MPPKRKSKSDIHSPKLIEQFAPSLRQRMGEHLFEQRLEREKSINPTRSLTLDKALNWISHNGSHCLIVTVLSLLGLRKKAVANCWQPKLEENNLSLNSALSKPLRVLHLSDLHLDTNPDQVNSWIELIRQSDYDLCVITGDFFNAFQIPTQALKAELKKVIQSIHQPVYGILGNHDVIMTAPIVEELGVRMLINESDEISIHGQRILISGIDDPHTFRTHDISKAAQPVSDNVDRFHLKIALAHSPRDAEMFSERNFDLFLCGHTHGGQLCTKNGYPLVKNGPYPVEQISGVWKHKGMTGYTSRGTGTGKLSFRLNCPPEIVVHNLC